MKLRTQLIFAFGIVASIPMVGGGVELYAHRDAYARANTALDVGRATRDGIDAARRAQFHFKLQLQEWNNILLHGHDKTLYDKHLSDFALAEQSVQRALAASATIAPELGLDVAEIQALLRMHEAVGKKYREALRQFSTADPASSVTVDNLVTGIDRAPSAALDVLAAHFIQQAETRLAAIRNQLDTRGRMLEWIISVGSAVGIALGAPDSAGGRAWLSRAISARRPVACGIAPTPSRVQPSRWPA